MYEIFDKLLKERGLTAYKVSQATGIPNTTLSAWKRGISQLKVEKLELIAKYLNVSVAYLMGRTSDPTPINENVKIEEENEELSFFNELFKHYKQMDESKRKAIYKITADMSEMDENDIEFFENVLKIYQEKRKARETNKPR